MFLRIVRGRAGAALLSAALAATALTLAQHPASADAVAHCGQYETAPVAGGRYIVDNNNYGPGVSQCLSTDGNADFTLTSSSAAASPPSGPVSYPEIFEGCHWNTCTSGSALPIQVSRLGSSTSSWATTPAATGNYNVAYDLWFNSTPTTPADNGQPDGAELMIWLDREPASDSPPGTVANIGGTGYVTWQTSISANGKSWPLLGYRMQTPTNSVSDLDLRAFVRDAVVRGVVKPDSYLISVEAGFELWSGGSGLRTDSYSSTSVPGYPVGPVPAGTAGLCLDDFRGGTTDGNPVAIWGCGTPTQNWTVAIDGTIQHAGLCLGTTGDLVALHTCNGSPYQVWLPGLAGGLWNEGSGLCLHDPSSGTAPGTQLDLTTCNGAADQRWTLPTTVANSPA